MADAVTPSPGDVAFYIVTGVEPGGEGGLGEDSSGTERPNTDACP